VVVLGKPCGMSYKLLTKQMHHKRGCTCRLYNWELPLMFEESVFSPTFFGRRLIFASTPSSSLPPCLIAECDSTCWRIRENPTVTYQESTVENAMRRRDEYLYHNGKKPPKLQPKSPLFCQKMYHSPVLFIT
jgi:hypothetical protein